MSLTTQVKMLRVLEERKVIAVGSIRAEPVDVRIIAATNRDIEAEVRSRNFREDLFYRLNVIPLFIPSLRERKDDIPLLAGYFLARYSRQMKKDVHGISPGARLSLSEYDWPGNVRELENIIQRHVALCEGNTIERIQLPDMSRSSRPAAGAREPLVEGIPPEGFNLLEKMDEYERSFIREALKAPNGNLTNAAKILGMSYRSIRYRVKKLGVKHS
jgi:two-component system response regulator PilR (NtrC family)